ncbi:AzlC family ABC transporter permease [Rhodococcus sp. 3Y1]
MGSRFTSLIYAGSLEFLAVGMVAAMTPLPYVALTALLVNFRHVFYALSFPLERFATPSPASTACSR